MVKNRAAVTATPATITLRYQTDFVFSLTGSKMIKLIRNLIKYEWKSGKNFSSFSIACQLNSNCMKVFQL